MVDEIQAHTAYIDELIAADAVIRGRLTTSEADIGDLKADNATIKGTLVAQSARIDQIEAGSISTEYLEANYAKISALNATNANVSTLQTNYANVSVELTAAKADITTLTSKEAAFETATAQNFTAVNADISNLSADYASFKTETVGSLTAIEADIQSLDTEYAQIDFANIGDAAIERIFSDYGMIKNLMIEEGAVTGELNGVTINGDLINANTLKADRLIVRGDDGLYYRLNVDSLGQTKADSDEKYQNGLDGSVIVAKSITAGKVSVTDLYAFDATIGGFDITETTINNVGKDSVDSVVPGLYMNKNGEVVFGDAGNFIKFYKVLDEDAETESFKLVIQASNIDMHFDSTGESSSVESSFVSIGSEVEDVDGRTKENADNIEGLSNEVSDVRDIADAASNYISSISDSISVHEGDAETKKRISIGGNFKMDVYDDNISFDYDDSETQSNPVKLRVHNVEVSEELNLKKDITMKDNNGGFRFKLHDGGNLGIVWEEGE